jgi:RNA polymerase sigma-32 factor
MKKKASPPAAAKRGASKGKAKAKPKVKKPDSVLPPETSDADHDSAGLPVESDHLPDTAEIDVKTLALPAEEGSPSLDALQKYLAEIRRYPLLTPEEERRLAIHYKETGDRKAAEALVTANLRFVVKVAAEYSRFGARMIDLIQEGNVGLMHAVREFNPYKGVRLITYAVWWIRGYIQEYLMKNYSQVRIGTTQAQKKLFYHLNKEKAKLDALGSAPDVKLLSSRLGVTEDEVREMEKRMSGRDLSLDAPQGDDDPGRRWIDSQTDESAAPIDEKLALSEEKEIFRREISKVRALLNEKEKYLLEHRILGDPPLTLQEVGDHFKITRERARQLEERVISKIKEHFQSAFPDYKINLPKD